MGVISVGLFADGTNGVKGLFYGDPTQSVAQLIGVGTCSVLFSLRPTCLIWRFMPLSDSGSQRRMNSKAWTSLRWELFAIPSSF